MSLRTIFARLGRLIQSRPLIMLTAVVVVTGIAFSGAAQIESVTGDRAFVGENPTLNTYDDNFDRGTIATLVRGEVTEPATMRAIDRYDRRMSEVDDVEQVISPADQVRAEYGRIPGSQEKIQRVVGNPDSTVVTIVLEPGLTQQQSRPIYTDAINAKEWGEFPSGVSVTITGSAAFSSQLSGLIQQSTQQLLGLAVGLMVIALFFLFRGVRLRLLPIVAVFVGVIWTFGAIGYAGIPNSTLTSSVFPILIGLGIDYSIQFHERYEEELENHRPREALPLALGGVGPPVLVAMFSAALGFGATWVSTIGSPAFVWFAQTSIFGVVLTFTTGLFVLLPVLTLWVRFRSTSEEEASPSHESEFPPQEQTGSSNIGRLGQALGRTSRTLAANPFIVLSIAIVVAAGGFAVSSDLETTADTEEFIPQDLPAYTDLQEFRSVAGGGDAVQYSILVSGEQLRDPDVLRWMERFRVIASDKQQITSVSTPATLIKQHNGGTLPETEREVRQTLAAIPDDQKAQYYSNGHAQIRITAEQDMNTDEELGLFDTIETSIALSQPPSGVDAKLTGQSPVSTPSIVEQIENRNATTGLGFALVFGALLLYYRNLLRAVAPLVPMLFVIGWQNLYMLALSISVSPLGASLGAMSVGIGAEYTIIVMERYFEEVEQTGISRLDAVETAGSRVGKAITVSGMTTVFGFSALTLSPFPILADFGWLTVGVIFFTLIASLATLPPTLIALGRLSDKIESVRADKAASRNIVPSETDD
nr:RND family transporter [Haloarcula sp. JP-Z28]